MRLRKGLRATVGSEVDRVARHVRQIIRAPRAEIIHPHYLMPFRQKPITQV